MLKPLFNKINNIAKQYYKVMPAIHNKKIDSQFLKGMYEFINDTFQLSTKGFTERPEWVNDISRTLLSAYTLKTMGFSTTGAMRNLFSGVYFFENAIFICLARFILISILNVYDGTSPLS